MTQHGMRDRLVVGVCDVIVARCLSPESIPSDIHSFNETPQVPRAFPALRRLHARFCDRLVILDESKVPMCTEHRNWLIHHGFSSATGIPLSQAMFFHHRTRWHGHLKRFAEFITALDGALIVVHSKLEVLRAFAGPRTRLFLFCPPPRIISMRECQGMPSFEVVISWRQVEGILEHEP